MKLRFTRINFATKFLTFDNNGELQIIVMIGINSHLASSTWEKPSF